MTTARDLFARMKSDPPKLTNGERLDVHLARVTNLTVDRSIVALEEYLRFLALAAAGPDMAVPSPFIDAVWHKHLEDTRAYQEYCTRVIGRFVHHTPNLEHQRDHAGYPHTLANYRTVFELDPDPRVWPTVAMMYKLETDVILGVAAVMTVFLAVAMADNSANSFLQIAGKIVFLGAGAFLVYVGVGISNGPWQIGSKSDGGGG